MIPALLALAGLGISVFGMIKEGEDKAEAAEKQAENARLQAIQTEKWAKRETELTTVREQNVRGSQKAAIASSGFDIAGSPMAQIANTMHAAAEERSAIETESQYRQWSAMNDATGYNAYAGRARDASGIQAGGTILTGAGQIAQNWSNQSKPQPKSGST